MTNNALILITDGQASWSINGRVQHVHLGNLLAVEKNSVVEILDNSNYALAEWIIYFYPASLKKMKKLYNAICLIK